MKLLISFYDEKCIDTSHILYCKRALYSQLLLQWHSLMLPALQYVYNHLVNILVNFEHKQIEVSKVVYYNALNYVL